jgi:hypothetical protein
LHSDSRQCGQRQRGLALSCQPSFGRSAATVVSMGGGRDRFTGYAIMKATDAITVVEGYDAMRIFLEPFGGAMAMPPGKSSFSSAA